MHKTYFFVLFFALNLLRAHAQDPAAYLKSNAVVISDPEHLTDSVYSLLGGFPIIMMGEMHGTNESAPFVGGLVRLLCSQGDSVQLGLEIPPELMERYVAARTDSSIYQSTFFGNPPYYDGKQSVPWARLLAEVNRNPRAQVFFFDVDRSEQAYDRDSLMAAKIKARYELHPGWKMVTLSGNYHNRLAEPGVMISVLKRHLDVEICSLNLEYQEGACRANFGHGLEIKQFTRSPSVYNSTPGYERYILLLPESSPYPFNGFYFTKNITPAEMVHDR